MSHKADRRRSELLFLCSGWSALLSLLAVLPHHVIAAAVPVRLTFDEGHVLGYAVLEFLLLAYLTAYRERFSGTSFLRHPVPASLLLMFFWGALNEVLQLGTRDRFCNYYDLGWDSVGAALGLTAFFLLKKSASTLFSKFVPGSQGRFSSEGTGPMPLS